MRLSQQFQYLVTGIKQGYICKCLEIPYIKTQDVLSSVALDKAMLEADLYVTIKVTYYMCVFNVDNDPYQDKDILGFNADNEIVEIPNYVTNINQLSNVYKLGNPWWD